MFVAVEQAPLTIVCNIQPSCESDGVFMGGTDDNHHIMDVSFSGDACCFLGNQQCCLLVEIANQNLQHLRIPKRNFHHRTGKDDFDVSHKQHRQLSLHVAINSVCASLYSTKGGPFHTESVTPLLYLICSQPTVTAVKKDAATWVRIFFRLQWCIERIHFPDALQCTIGKMFVGK